MHNYKLTLQYDGTRYSGWQRQGNTQNTIQGKLEALLSEMLGEPIEGNGSGRTDAGAHAIGQTANFRCSQALDCEAFLLQLNRALPGDIAAVAMEPVGPRFHARLSARDKTYCYRIWNSEIPNVFARKYLYQMSEPLDLAAMEAAGQKFLGCHDFRGFSSGRTKKSTERELFACRVERLGDEVRLTVRGSGFLYHMVRILAGTLLEIGTGARAAESIDAVFATQDRSLAGPMLPAQGLCLMEVSYGGKGT